MLSSYLTEPEVLQVGFPEQALVIRREIQPDTSFVVQDGQAVVFTRDAGGERTILGCTTEAGEYTLAGQGISSGCAAFYINTAVFRRNIFQCTTPYYFNDAACGELCFEYSGDFDFKIISPVVFLESCGIEDEETFTMRELLLKSGAKLSNRLFDSLEMIFAECEKNGIRYFQVKKQVKQSKQEIMKMLNWEAQFGISFVGVHLNDFVFDEESAKKVSDARRNQSTREVAPERPNDGQKALQSPVTITSFEDFKAPAATPQPPRSKEAQGSLWTCRRCGCQENEGKFCIQCGVRRDAIICGHCGWMWNGGTSVKPLFCGECGEKLKKGAE